MGISTMQTSVLQTTLLNAAQLVVSHAIKTYSRDIDDPAFLNVTKVMNERSKTNANASSSASPPCLECVSDDFPFYTAVLPRRLLCCALVSVLEYSCDVLLERVLPMRPGRFVAHEQRPKEKEAGFDGDSIDDEGREEEVVRRWIAKGKVRRTSISWCNTLLKYILTLSVGRLLSITLDQLATAILFGYDLQQKLDRLNVIVLVSWIGSFVSLSPLTTLTGLIVVPAPRRIIFKAGIDAVTAPFFIMFFRLMLVWAARTDIVQEYIRNSTATDWDAIHGNMSTVRSADEL